ncbi:MAG: hypothetical protein QNJ13_12520 [Paracoccaceae bacterium]|nr:hypothetical protein [Paracoccaceae bacterium]
MSDFDIEVIGGPPPRRPPGPLKRLMARLRLGLHRLLMRPRRMIVIGMAGYLLIVGTPHVGWDYECRHPMRGPATCQSVAWCAYYGVQGRRIAVPRDGVQCSLVKVLPLDFAQLFGG